jgi:hypothetical protein
MLDVREVIPPVDVDSSHFNLITWSSSVDEIVKEEYLFLSGDSTGGHGAWGLLDGHFLVVPVDCVGVIE